MPPGHGSSEHWAPAAPPYPMAPVAPPPPPRPRAVTAAFWVTLVGAGLYLAAVGLALGVDWEGVRDLVREDYLERGEAFTSSDLDTGARGVALVFGLVSVVVVAPYVTFAALALGGRNWARVLLTVLVSIGGFVGLFGLFPSYDHPLGPVLRVVLLALVAAAITVVALLFGREANRYFAR